MYIYIYIYISAIALDNSSFSFILCVASNLYPKKTPQTDTQASRIP